MSAHLFCKTGALSGSEYSIGEEATIGRGAQNDITLPPDAVSGQHARIFFDDDEGCYVLEDLDSSNGTQLDDTEVIDPVPLKDLHVITFAQKLDFIFLAASETAIASSAEGAKTQLGAAPESPSTLPGEDTPEGERTRIGGMGEPPSELPPEEPNGDESDEEGHTQRGPDAPALPDLPEDEPSSRKDPADEASPQYALQVTLEGAPQGTHSLPEGEVLIGRSSDCDIQIEDPGVSRRHARLIVKPGEVVVEDVGSKNFTFVNEARLTGPTPLSPGAEIQFGLQAKAILQRTSA